MTVNTKISSVIALLFNFFQDVSGGISHFSIKVFDNVAILYPYTSILSSFWLDTKLENMSIGEELRYFPVLLNYRPCTAWGFNQLVFNLNHINLTHAIFYYPFSFTPYSAMSIKETVHL